MHDQLYVDLSRAKSIQGLNLKCDMTEKTLIVDSSVNVFYNKVSGTTDHKEFTIEDIIYEEVNF